MDLRRAPVVEVCAMNVQRGQTWHSCGLDEGNAYSLRISWLKGVRPDKAPRQATTTDMVKNSFARGEVVA